MGGEAVANGDNVSEWEGGQRLVNQAIETFGDLHVLVNNAGILRDRVLVNMSEEEWDAVIQVHLKGHFVPSRWAAAYWREQTKAGQAVRASIINTSSTSGLLGNPGQSNYGAAKAGIGAFTVITAQELGRYGVRVNAIAPAARTRMTEQTPGLEDIVKAPPDPAIFDTWDPANVSPLAAALSTAGSVVGMAPTAVWPPRAAAREPLSTVSASSCPGSRRWVCRSTSPGATRQPSASRTVAPGAGRSPGATWCTTPSTTATSARRLPSASTTVPPRTSSRAGRSGTGHLRARRAGVGAEQQVQHGHAHRHPVGDLAPHQGAGQIGDVGGDLDAAGHPTGVPPPGAGGPPGRPAGIREREILRTRYSPVCARTRSR